MRKNNPRIARAFDLYLACRSLSFVHIPINKDRGKKIEHKVLPFVSGWSALPEQGGMLEQPVWTMTMFNIFRSAENLGVKEENL